MKNWTLQRRVVFGFGLIIAISAVICTFATWRLSSIQTQAGRIETHTVPSLHLVGEINGLFDMDYAGVLEYMHATNATERSQIEVVFSKFLGELDQRVKEWQNTVSDDSERRLEREFITARDEYLAARPKPKRSKLCSPTNSDPSTYGSKRSWMSCPTTITAMA